MPISLFEFSQSVSKLSKDKKYLDALKHFKENKTQFSPEQIGSNEYLIAGMLTALRKTDHCDDAFKFLDIYKITIDEKTNDHLLSSYGWLLFSKIKNDNYLDDNNFIDAEVFDDEEVEALSNCNYDKSDIIRRIEFIIPLLFKNNNDYTYSVISSLFNIVLKTEKKKPNTNWKFINEFCDLIQPDRLHTECKTIEVVRKGQKKLMELASDMENWYAYKSKALLKLGIFEKCYEISSKALELFKAFHYSNDVWFARRIALSKKNLGNSLEAIDELEQVLRRKKEWFIQKELAVLYQENGDVEKSFKYAIEAINNHGDLEYKVDLLFLIAELLMAKQENDLAYKHYSLSFLLRIQEEWKIPAKLNSVFATFGKQSIPPIETLPELKKELRNYWNSFNSHQTSFQQNTAKISSGTIEKILHNNEKGVDGFIKYDNYKSIYFIVNANEEITKNIKVGIKVNFKLLPATNGKKEKAIQLKIVKL